MIDIFHREWVYLWYYFTVQLEQIAPYWAIGIILGSCISVFGKDKIHQFLMAMQSRRLGIFGIIPASLLGIASPLCMYGTIPIAASFSQKGMPDDWLAAFMMCSILLNPQLMIYSAALGPTALWVRILSCFFCGIAAGLLLRFLFKGKPFFIFPALQNRFLMTRTPICSCAFSKILAVISGQLAPGFFWVFSYLLFFSAMFPRMLLQLYLAKMKDLAY